MEKINIQKIEKLLNSSNREDVILGTQFIYGYFKGNKQKLKDYFIEHFSKVEELDIYIGEINITYFGEFANTSVYGKATTPVNNLKNVIYL